MDLYALITHQYIILIKILLSTLFTYWILFVSWNMINLICFMIIFKGYCKCAEALTSYCTIICTTFFFFLQNKLEGGQWLQPWTLMSCPLNVCFQQRADNSISLKCKLFKFPKPHVRQHTDLQNLHMVQLNRMSNNPGGKNCIFGFCYIMWGDALRALIKSCMATVIGWKEIVCL